MGSKISKAIRPREKAAVPIATASSHHHSIDNVNKEPRQDFTTRLSPCDPNGAIARRPQSHDDLYVATSTVPHINLRRRNSESSWTATREDIRNMEHILLVSFEQFLAERQLLNIDWETAPPPTHLPPQPSPPPATVHRSSEPFHQCLICCSTLPSKKDLNYVKEVVKPCNCDNEYCTSCIKKMFLDSCKDTTRMPPRCCVPINLHHARPHLTQEEANLFRAKYEEWSTPKPFYCPVPVCSAFIPERHLPQRVKDKQRTDSGIGMPTPQVFACTTCEAGICLECRQVAHPGSICNIQEFGLDTETAALLTSWGYKKCPKCGHGLKRMFGCNHMECRCGAHFCWVCMNNMDECDGGCYDDEEYDEEFESDEDSDNESSHEGGAIDNAITLAERQQSTAAEGATETASDPRPIPIHGNLDGGGARYWEESFLDFGEEPSNVFQDRAWGCRHSFSETKIPFAVALTSQTIEMECVRCWNTIHPQLRIPHSTSDKIFPAMSSRARDFGVRGGRGLRRDRVAYTPPHGLFRADATIGTAPHLTTTISPLSQSVPARGTSPMADVQFSERIVDTYGNVVTTSPDQMKRRASFDDMLDVFADITKSTKSAPVKSFGSGSIFNNTPSSLPFNLAHECRHCNILLCELCKDSAIVVQEAREKKEEEQREARRLERETEDRERQDRERAEADAAITLDGLPGDREEMEMAPPSIFD